MTLLKRIFREKRVIAIPLVLGLLVNIGVYALVVYPLQAKSANAANRAALAAAALKAAEADQESARTLVTGKSRADEELMTFYDKVLPVGIPGARSQTYARLPALARKTNVKYEERRTEIDATLKSVRIGRLRSRMVLQGEYENLRQFIYELENAPEFVIIDDVAIAQLEANKPLTLTLDLSTYFRLGANGT